MLLCHSATPHKGFIWICATDHIQLGCDTIPELQFSSELFVFQLSELSTWHKWPSGREQQEVGMEQCDLLWKPPSLRETPEELNVPPKIFWFLSHKLQ